ncbi:hypothetical protein OG21DRAFT_398416 [Imleria badia]|nr:hypothetical protein OG21DRAFT_398416 [Imleria badia]
MLASRFPLNTLSYRFTHFVVLTSLGNTTRLDMARDVFPNDGPTQSEHACGTDLCNVPARVEFVYHACTTVQFSSPMLLTFLSAHGLSWSLVKPEICFNSERIELRNANGSFYAAIQRPRVRRYSSSSQWTKRNLPARLTNARKDTGNGREGTACYQGTCLFLVPSSILHRIPFRGRR